ncbi:ribosomal protein S18-alanine N-acetyltransferase [Herbaspirillum sp. RV1423]|uniref:ribosomal protein S18-alanine N-acetyltransferase n=1 Tax=Herbaspirillum sp. RV1423 TaxID=1443993 RepID=UPI0004BBDD36|nr:ribosomal protein S18-alanine N-acetyltransferase [Herbaspirillum sp. RV1423]
MSSGALLHTLESRFGKLEFTAMQVADMDEVVHIEDRIYSHPWTRGNFLDSLYSGYQTLTMRDPSGRLLGYFLVMEAVDEAHLLNISVAEDVQGEGIGHLLLDYAVDLARKHRMRVMLLEVRVSNLRALHVYRRYGFVEIGRRKNYYPADQHTREDAIVMSLTL